MTFIKSAVSVFNYQEHPTKIISKMPDIQENANKMLYDCF